MDPAKWEPMEEGDSSSGVMISNLPLLFANGLPTALNQMTVEHLLNFFPFMVRCSVAENMSMEWQQLPRPPWWPKRLPFRIPSDTPKVSAKDLMVCLIERCYSYHGCQYLLQFCSRLVSLKPSNGYRFTDNRDGTTSMYDGSTGKLLVTFRNENREYDKDKICPKTPQRKLLPSLSSSGKHKSLLYGSLSANGRDGHKAMVKPPIADVYLCDKCDNEFSSLKEVQIHESQCFGCLPIPPITTSPEPETAEEELCAGEKVPFLSYMGLMPTKKSGVKPYVSPKKKSAPPRPQYWSLTHFDSVDICSPLGRKILQNLRNPSKLSVAQHQVLRYERHIYAYPDYVDAPRQKRNANRWIVVWKQRRGSKWAHLYCFNKKQKAERLITIRAGLTHRSHQLVKKCRPLRIKLKRLTKKEMGAYTAKNVPFIDTTKDLVNGSGDCDTREEDPLALDCNGVDTDDGYKLLIEELARNDVTIEVKKVKYETDSKLVAVNDKKPLPPKKQTNYELIVLSSEDESDIEIISDLTNTKNSKNVNSHWSSETSSECGHYSEKSAVNGFTGMPPPILPKSSSSMYTTKSSSYQMRELRKLNRDECRELNENGLRILHSLNKCDSDTKILTRLSAKEKLAKNSKIEKKALCQPRLHPRPKKLQNKKIDENGNSNYGQTSNPENSHEVEAHKKLSASRIEISNSSAKLNGISRTNCISPKNSTIRTNSTIPKYPVKSKVSRLPSPSISFKKGESCYKSNDKLYYNCKSPKKLLSPKKFLMEKMFFEEVGKGLCKELNMLMGDEYKELRASGNHPSQILLHSYQNEPKDKLIFSFAENLEIKKPTRHQTNLMPVFTTETPRQAHRKLIQSQMGMCVLNYTLPKLR